MNAKERRDARDAGRGVEWVTWGKKTTRGNGKARAVVTRGWMED